MCKSGRGGYVFTFRVRGADLFLVKILMKRREAPYGVSGCVLEETASSSGTPNPKFGRDFGNRACARTCVLDSTKNVRALRAT